MSSFSPLYESGTGFIPQKEEGIRVAIVEDDAIFRRALETAVNSHPKLRHAWSVGTAQAAIEHIGSQPADVYLIDLGLPDMSGEEVVRFVAQKQPEANALVLTLFGDHASIISSLEAGATGYLLKDTPLALLPKHIMQIHTGGSPISPSVARLILQRFAEKNMLPPQGTHLAEDDGDHDEHQAHLSRREEQVLGHLQRGLSYQEIALKMDLSYHTITTYLRRIYRKLGVNSRAEAVYKAQTTGIL